MKKTKEELEADEKDRKEWGELNSCKTIEDYKRFIETNPSAYHKLCAESQINALKDEPINLTISLIINILSISAVIVGLCINNMDFIGISLLAFGILAIIVHSFAVKKWKAYWDYHALDNYLTSSAIVLIIIGAIVCLRMLFLSLD